MLRIVEYESTWPGGQNGILVAVPKHLIFAGECVSVKVKRIDLA